MVFIGYCASPRIFLNLDGLNFGEEQNPNIPGWCTLISALSEESVSYPRIELQGLQMQKIVIPFLLPAVCYCPLIHTPGSMGNSYISDRLPGHPLSW